MVIAETALCLAHNLDAVKERAVQHQGNSLPFKYGVGVAHLEAVHEAVTSDVAARRRSGS